MKHVIIKFRDVATDSIIELKSKIPEDELPSLYELRREAFIDCLRHVRSTIGEGYVWSYYQSFADEIMRHIVDPLLAELNEAQIKLGRASDSENSQTEARQNEHMKQFTLENLTKDCACGSGMEFVTPIIEAGKSVPQALKDAGHVDWISWALKKGYDLEEIRSENFFWDDHGHITAITGDSGTAIAGYGGIAIAGNHGVAIAGYGGTAKAGHRGKAEAGYKGTAMVGDYGIIQIAYIKNVRYRIATGYIGENGLKPNTPYRVDNDGNFYEVTDPIA